MASAASIPQSPPPPGPGDSQGSPTNPPSISPSPGIPAPEANAATGQLIQITAATRALAKQYPQIAPEMMQINDLVKEAMPKILQTQQPGEPQAPPV